MNLERSVWLEPGHYGRDVACGLVVVAGSVNAAWWACFRASHDPLPRYWPWARHGDVSARLAQGYGRNQQLSPPEGRRSTDGGRRECIYRWDQRADRGRRRRIRRAA